jgi:iron complex outermembrane receptor protein
MDYKYASRPSVTREGGYHDYFPSFTAKYAIAPNFLADIGLGKAIKRPNLSQIAGVRQVYDESETVVTPNPNLGPERSEKVVAALSYFFGRAGSNNLQVVAGYNQIADQQVGRTLSSEEYGNTDPALDGYDFVSFTNESSPLRYKSLEVSYRHALTFLPRVMQGTSLDVSYTRTQTSRRVYNAVPHSIKGGIRYSYKRFSFNFNGIWRDDTPWFQGTNNRYLKSNVKFDVSGGFRINDRVTFYFSGRNVFEEPHRIFETSAGNPDVVYRYENYGTNWSFGFRGNF